MAELLLEMKLVSLQWMDRGWLGISCLETVIFDDGDVVAAGLEGEVGSGMTASFSVPADSRFSLTG